MPITDFQTESSLILVIVYLALKKGPAYSHIIVEVFAITILLDYYFKVCNGTGLLRSCFSSL